MERAAPRQQAVLSSRNVSRGSGRPTSGRFARAAASSAGAAWLWAACRQPCFSARKKIEPAVTPPSLGLKVGHLVAHSPSWYLSDLDDQCSKSARPSSLPPVSA